MIDLSQDITLKEIRARYLKRTDGGYRYPEPGRMWLDARALLFMIEDLENELRLARQHLNVCPTAVAIAEEDAAKRRAG